MIKRIISGAMSLIVSCSLLTSVDIFNQKDVVIKNQVDNQISGNEDYNLNSTNSLGNYICEVATEQQRLANTASAAESEIFAVSQLEFDNISGEFIVKSSQTKACTAKVSIVEETSGETVLEKTADVKIGEDVITKGTINVSELPEFYYVTAELFDAEGKSLCSKITCETYTKTMQEILAADIHDFDENLVVNLDESEDTNFLVLDEETIIAESSEDTNNLESADYENNVFVFNNADETIQDLKEGDNFYIQASEQDIIAVSVDSVEVNENNQVIVSGNDENVEEMFSFIKFEGTADTSDAEFDMSTADEGVELDGMVEASNFMENVDAFKININGTSNKRGLFDVDKNFEAQANVTFPIEDEDVGFKASIEVGFKVSFSIYKKRSYVNLELKSEFPFKVSATLGETPSDDPLFEKSFGTAVIPLPVAGIKLEIEPKLVVEAKVTVEASYSATPGFSLTYDSDVGVEFNKLSDSFNSNEKFSLNVSGEAFIGIDFSPRLVAVSEKITKIEVGLKTGLKITAEMENSISEGNEFTVLGVGYCGDSVHACGLCIKGTADFVLEGSAKLKVLFAEVEASINIGRFSLPDWYFSISNKGKFGLGTCPNLAYNTTFTILDKDGAPVSGAKVVVDSNEYYTDGNGFVNLYAKCQGHSYSVYVDGVKKKSGSFTIYNNTKDLTIKLDGSSVVTNDTPVSTATTPVITTVKKVTTTVTKSEKQQMMTAIASGRLGDNINYIHYADGFMWIHGYGDMYDYSSCPFKYPEKITDIDIENEDPASGLNITSIGNNVFKNCVNVPEFNIPSTVKRIGHNAFYNCSEAKFTDFAFTSNLTSIGQSAFYNCNKLKFGDLKFSSKLTSIGSLAFYNCDGITNVTIPGSVKTIGDNVFDDCSSLKTLVVKDGVGTIGNYILNKCIAVESVTFPFVGNTLENTNKSDSNYQLAARLFNSSVEGKTYYTGNYYVP
ncbi:MAG: leucine-rich repeat domain-containing protein, partial [Ruminococcus sp.]|nr:leucine-rich repeat domain-containing protein [Ruminococcus sp.]